MIADGYVASKKNIDGEYVNVGFASKDKELTEFICHSLCEKQTIPQYKPKGGQTSYVWHIRSERLAKILIGFGIIPRKSLIAELPKVPKDFTWDLVRGILDGDGFIHKKGYIAFYSGSKTFIDQLSELLQKEGLHPYLCEKEKAGGVYRIELRKADSVRLAELLYSSNKFCLQRKKKRAILQLSLKVPPF